MKKKKLKTKDDQNWWGGGGVGAEKGIGKLVWLLPRRAWNVDFISVNLFYVTSLPDLGVPSAIFLLNATAYIVDACLFFFFSIFLQAPVSPPLPPQPDSVPWVL